MRLQISVLNKDMVADIASLNLPMSMVFLAPSTNVHSLDYEKQMETSVTLAH